MRDLEDHSTRPDPAIGPIGRRRFIQGVGVLAGAAAVSSVLPEGIAKAAPAGASQFIPLPVAIRVVDTRDPGKYVFSRYDVNHISVPIAGSYGVPANASAIVATVTAVDLATGNWMTVVPAGTDIIGNLNQNRLVSVLNMSGFGQATANLTQVRLASGAVEMFSLAPCEMILDVIGYYLPVSGPVREGRFIGLGTAQRAIDTRNTIGYVDAGQTLVVDLTPYVPADASSAVINLTATECLAPSFFTVYPYTSNDVPFVSSLNVNAEGETRAAAVIAPVTTVDGMRRIKVYALQPAKLIVDVTGYFTSTASLADDKGLFVPIDPVRILDTRNPGSTGKLWPGWFVEGLIPGDGSLIGSAAVVNVTGVESRAPGYLTMAAARQPLPGTSNLNFATGGQVVPNQVITPITQSYGYQVYSSSGAHVVVDYTGYYTGTPMIPRLASAPVNPPPPPIGPTWILRVPKIGLTSQVRAGDSNTVCNAGYSWHWTGTGYMGQDAHVAAFAHRTTHGGPYRYINELTGGDQFTVSTADGRTYTYEVRDRFLTDSNTQHILEATRFIDEPVTFSLIACTLPNFEPTSTSWRMVVTGVLLGWS